LKKVIVLLLIGIMSLSVCGICYAEELDTPEDEALLDEYQTVSDFSAKLTKQGADKAVWSASANAKKGITSMSGTIKLVNASGKVVKTSNVTFSKGAKFTATKTMTMPSKGTYHVKYTIKTYKSGTYQETISGKTNTIKR